ncbi:hypothetical protein P7D73_18240 [Enterococcus raffinosus]|uniref:hypothetical protein n=1 Tax=Enterococcus raffinosus TaxID=71452 RepID=UPI00288D34BA|nr:hypothetical protein [Enterococcus raffinosus]MDT2525147.1 hypothetical protein [Enterococcus raffinosus]MDT2592502.1 hypothetical protein [Enterococcus raffinosus]
MKLRKLEIIEDPCFYQYVTEKDLEKFNTIELTIALSVLRVEQRRLQDKVQVRGTYNKKTAEKIDRDNFFAIRNYRKSLEQILFDKQGFIPAQITKPTIDKLIIQNKKTLEKFANKKHKL